MAFPLDKKYITELENELGLTFPPAFCQKMILNNGGELSTEFDDWNLYPFFDKTDTKRISRTCNHIGLETKNAREWKNFPADGIAIASNGCGDQMILLSNSLDNKILNDTIFIWRHETGEIEEIADSINEIIN